MLVSGAQSHGFQDDDQESQTHGQLREQIVKRDRKSEV
jgi:hypothetical protein